MRNFGEAEILALAAKWQRRAKVFMREAGNATTSDDRVRLAAMVSTLHYAANDLCSEAGVDPESIPLPPDPEVEQHRRRADELLAVRPGSSRS